MGYFDFPRCLQCGGKLHEYGMQLKCGDCGVPAGKTAELDEQARRREEERLAAERARVERRTEQLGEDMASLEAAQAKQAAPVDLAGALASKPVFELPAPDIGPEDMTATQIAQRIDTTDPEARPAPAPRGKRR